MWKMYQEASKQAKMTLFGTILIKFSSSLAMIWGSCNIYFFSYFKHNGEIIDQKTNSKLLLFALIPLSVVILLANPFSRLVGYKLAIRMWCFIYILSPMMINFSLTTTTFAIFWLLIPISSFCMASVPIINCLWTQFPRDLNKISGIAILMFSLGMIFWNLAFMSIVNPQNVKSVVDEYGIPVFPEQVSKNVIRASNIVFISAGFMNMLGSFMVSRRESSILQQNILKPPEKLVIEGGDIIADLGRAVSEISLKEQIKTLKEGLLDKKFILLLWISFLNPIYLVYLMQNIKLIYMPIINDDHFLSYCIVLVTVSAVAGAPIWGYLGDLKGFRITLLWITIFDSVVKLFGIYCTSKWSLSILFFLLGANDKGLLTIIGPGLIGMFGIQMATELIPYKGLALILCYVIAPILQILLADIASFQNLLQIYFIASAIGICVAVYLKYKIHYKQIIPNAQEKQMKSYPIQAQKH